MKLRSLAGQRFERLLVLNQHKRTVTEFANSTGRKTWWLCRCDCGVEKWCQANHLRSGQVKSCGCLSAEIRVAMMHDQAKEISYDERLCRQSIAEAARIYYAIEMNVVEFQWWSEYLADLCVDDFWIGNMSIPFRMLTQAEIDAAEQIAKAESYVRTMRDNSSQ